MRRADIGMRVRLPGGCEVRRRLGGGSDERVVVDVDVDVDQGARQPGRAVAGAGHYAVSRRRLRTSRDVRGERQTLGGIGGSVPAVHLPLRSTVGRHRASGKISHAAARLR